MGFFHVSSKKSQNTKVKILPSEISKVKILPSKVEKNTGIVDRGSHPGTVSADALEWDVLGSDCVVILMLCESSLRADRVE